MKVGIQPMREDVTINSRQPSSPLHGLLSTITNEAEYHGQLLTLAEYDLPAEKGKAHTQKQYLQSFYGSRPDVLGFEFVVTRSVDNTHEYLGVVYDKSRIIDGAFDEFQKNKAAKAEEAKLRRAEKREKEALRDEAARDAAKLGA